MNSLDRHFKALLQDEINKKFVDAQTQLMLPASTEVSTNLHEIGVLRGYIKGTREIYDLCDEIMQELTEPEKKDASSSSGT